MWDYRYNNWTNIFSTLVGNMSGRVETCLAEPQEPRGGGKNAERRNQYYTMGGNISTVKKRQGVKIVEGGLGNGSKLTCLSALMFPPRIYRSRVSNCINEIGSIHTDGWDFVEWNRPSVYRQSFAKYKSPEKNIPHQLRGE